MKVARFRTAPGVTVAAAQIGGQWYDVWDWITADPGWATRYPDRSVWERDISWSHRPLVEAIPLMMAAAIPADERPLDIDAMHTLAPFWGGSTAFCAALNYHSHAQEAGLPPPSSPLFFIKPLSCVVGDGGEVLLPRISSQVDYEAELALVIGRTCRDLTLDEALEHVAAYTVVNDVSFRDLHARVDEAGARTMDWVQGKTLDTAFPAGPFLVTPDEVGDISELGLRLWVNDVLCQDGSTSDMVFSPAELLVNLSRDRTLYPGDVVATGTCGGVGKFSGRYLHEGDVVRIDIQNVGTLKHKVAAR